MSLALWIGCTLCLVALAGCRSDADKPIGKPVQIEAPLGLPPVPYPKKNPPTAETIALGQSLFFDPRLSGSDTISCASCHRPSLGFSDKTAVSRGVGGAAGTRNSPTLLNAAYEPHHFFWDGRAPSLEEQSAGPMSSPTEMDQNHVVTLFRLNADSTYRDMAQRAYGTPWLNLERVRRALASFERTLLSGDSPFDRYQYGGDKTALTPAQIRGLAVFQDPKRGNCSACHTIDQHYAVFTDGKFHNIGIGVRDDGTFADLGREVQTGKASDTGAFKTPTLRNVALTAPYMHDGSEKTLNEVVAYYAGKGNSNPYLDKEMSKINLSAQDRIDLVEFLKSLTGTMPAIGTPSPNK